MVAEAIAWGSSFWFRAASDAALDEAALTAIEFGWSPKATKPLYLEVYRPD